MTAHLVAFLVGLAIAFLMGLVGSVAVIVFLLAVDHAVASAAGGRGQLVEWWRRRREARRFRARVRR